MRTSRPTSAVMREINPDSYEWSQTAKTNVILADIWDLLAQINANLVAIGSKRPAKKPKPYPRPKRNDPENERHIGKGALPPDELRKWMEEKRKQHAAGSTSDVAGHPDDGGCTADDHR